MLYIQGNNSSWWKIFGVLASTTNLFKNRESEGIFMYTEPVYLYSFSFVF